MPGLMKRTWRLRIVLSAGMAFLTMVVAKSQNLVPNAGFERYHECPPNSISFYRKNYVMNWESPTAGTPDYFNACSNQSGVPFNWVGAAEAFDGNAYMGIIACMEQLDKNQIAYREYIRVKLIDSLRHGQTYFASMQLFLAQTSIMACNGLGMFFSASDLTSNIRYNYPITPDIRLPRNPIIDPVEKWIQVCGTFMATGEERYLIIGNFESDQTMEYRMFDPNLMESTSVNPMAYYYIDHVEVFHVTDSTKYYCEAQDLPIPKAFAGTIETNEPLVLSNLNFKTNEALILPSSYPELDNLARLLKQNSNLRASIAGHTDNSGTDQFNQSLSEQRALAVKRHLVNQGVEATKITTIGHGSRLPFAPNESAQGRQLNRRVEITLFNE